MARLYGRCECAPNDRIRFLSRHVIAALSRAGRPWNIIGREFPMMSRVRNARCFIDERRNGAEWNLFLKIEIARVCFVLLLVSNADKTSEYSQFDTRNLPLRVAVSRNRYRRTNLISQASLAEPAR